LGSARSVSAIPADDHATACGAGTAGLKQI
jgi:hypothetical protein